MTALQQNALGRFPLSEKAIENIYELCRGTEHLKTICESHERLRAELAGAEALLAEPLTQAAPDLLAACELSVRWLGNCVPVSEIEGPKPLPVLYAAISKAKGT